MQVSDTTVTRHRGYTQKLKRALALRVTWTSIPGRLSLRASRASTSHDTVNADISEISATSRHPHTPTDAHTFLSERDVTVTNQSDKDEQLPKIPRLDNRVQETFEVIELLKPREQAAAAESGRSQGSTKVQSLRSRLRLASRSTISSTVSCGSEVPPSADCAAATVAQQDQPAPRGRLKSRIHILRVLNSLKHTVNDIGSRRRSSTTTSLAGVSHHLSSSSSQRMTSSNTSCTASSTAVDAIPLSQVSSVGSPRSRRFDSERCTSSSSLVSTKI